MFCFVFLPAQFDLRSNLEADARVSFKRELGVTFNVSLDRSSTTQLIHVPVARIIGLPPVYLTVSYRADSAATVSAYSAGKASVRTAFNATGFVTACEGGWGGGIFFVCLLKSCFNLVKIVKSFFLEE